mgnify:CR=1 FL=1
MTEYKNVKTTQEEIGHKERVATFKVTQLLWWLLGILEGLLALRFLFKLIGVNPANTFASFTYQLTDIFVRPFANLTGTPEAGNMVFEFPTLIAMLIYALVGWALVKLVYLLFYRPQGAVQVSQTIVAQQTPSETQSSTSQSTVTDETHVYKNDTP